MSDFSDITDRPLRAYNRAVFFHNIYEDGGKAYAEDYINQFTDEEKGDIRDITKLVRVYGVKEVRAAINKQADQSGVRLEAVQYITQYPSTPNVHESRFFE